jgi:hypothetical protein
MRLKDEQLFYIHSMGKRIRITAIFHDVNDTNAYLTSHKDEGVIAEFKPYVFVANLYDSGI